MVQIALGFVCAHVMSYLHTDEGALDPGDYSARQLPCTASTCATATKHALAERRSAFSGSSFNPAQLKLYSQQVGLIASLHWEKMQQPAALPNLPPKSLLVSLQRLVVFLHKEVPWHSVLVLHSWV